MKFIRRMIQISCFSTLQICQKSGPKTHPHFCHQKFWFKQQGGTLVYFGFSAKKHVLHHTESSENIEKSVWPPTHVVQNYPN